MSFSIRKATPADAAAIATVNVDTWRTAFKGVVPDSYLASRDLVQRTADFTATLANPACEVYVGEVGGRVVGFAIGGPRAAPDGQGQGDLMALYVLEAHQRAGLGRALTRQVVARLLEMNLKHLIVWTLEKSPFWRFYEKLGGEKLESSRYERDFDGTKLNLIAYWYADLAALARRLADD